MPQFTPQASRPLSARAILGAVKRQRELCDIIERYAADESIRGKQQLSRAICGLSAHAQTLSRRHRGQPWQP